MIGYLRHAPTAFWVFVLVSLTALGVLGAVAMRDGVSPAAALAAPSQAPSGGVDALATGLTSLYPSVTAGTGLSWARSYAELARAERVNFEETGARQELSPLWRDVTDAADELARTDPSDKKAFLANAGLLGAAVGRLQSAYYDRPVVDPSR